MIRDDEVDPELSRTPRRFDAADAAIDRDHKRHAVGLQPIECFGLKTVTVLDAIREKVNDARTEQFERAPKNYGRGDAVAVVVSVNRDALFPLNRREDSIHGLRHVRKPERIVQVIERRAQKFLRALRVINAANREQPRESGADLQFLNEDVGGLIVASQTFPKKWD